ncbi:MAG: hypothetical protein Q4D61_05045 [Cardiobacteriaceae bacterium]|nr:hypothetical protein [Cardiobacteriaceae bacterium]
MAIPRTLILAWLTLLLLMLATLAWQNAAEKRQYLPVPENPEDIRINTGQHTLHWQRQQQHWLSNGQVADTPRIHTWLEELRACRGNYNEHDIAPTPNPEPIHLTIDNTPYTLGAANPFTNGHYIHHQNRVYLCNEAVKTPLRLPPDLWLENPDARTP